MRYARPHALSEDGRRLIVETDDGEQIAILADAQLRQLLRGDRPRPQLEIEMDTELTPRDIQTRIRAGASVEELADASGMPSSRIEAFASPVIAEREHIAGMAQNGSLRRRGEQAGHRTLQAAVGERLRERGVDPSSVQWDAFKMDDGRWSVSAGYRLEQADRQAVFYFDNRGRFSVTGNDEARWMVGEQAEDPAAELSEPDVDDTEPTLKLAGAADELALLRSVETGDQTVDDHSVGTDERAQSAESDRDEPAAPEDSSSSAPVEAEDARPAAESDDQNAANDDQDEPTGASVTDVTAADDEPAVDAEPSQLDLLYDILGGGDGYAEDSIRVYDGLSDAAAVPDVADGAWESQLDEDVPAEPEPETAQAQPDDVDVAEQDTSKTPEPVEGLTQPVDEHAEPVDEHPEPVDEHPEPVEGHPGNESTPTLIDDEPEQLNGSTNAVADEALPEVAQFPTAKATVEPTPESDRTESDQAEHDQTANDQAQNDQAGNDQARNDQQAAAPPAETGQATDQDEPTVLADGAAQDALPGADQEPAEKPKPKPKKRKRASVPSWDEIMFGSPKGK